MQRPKLSVIQILASHIAITILANSLLGWFDGSSILTFVIGILAVGALITIILPASAAYFTFQYTPTREKAGHASGAVLSAGAIGFFIATGAERSLIWVTGLFCLWACFAALRPNHQRLSSE